jgi:hypothetical protein
MNPYRGLAHLKLWLYIYRAPLFTLFSAYFMYPSFLDFLKL